MATFIVEHRLPGLRGEHLAAVHRALAESSRRLSIGPDRVSYVRSILVPARGACVCVFEATSSDLVRRVNEVAQVPFVALDEALTFENPGGDDPGRGSALHAIGDGWSGR